MVLFIYFILPLFQVVIFSLDQFDLRLLDILNFAASIFAFHWLLGNVLLASKLSWIDRFIAYDKRIKIHILTTSGVVVAIVYHVIYKIILMGYSFDLSTILLGGIFLIAMIIAVLWIPIPGFKRVRLAIVGGLKKLSERDYDKFRVDHSILILIVTLLLLIHVMDAELFIWVPIYSGALYVGFYIFTAGAFLFSRYIFRPYNGKVVEVTLIHDILTLKVETDKKLNYRSGQFAFIGVRDGRGRLREHPFSFLSTGNESDNIVSFGIRVVGDFTKMLSELEIGSDIRVRGPFGKFYPREDDSNICLIGSGIGIVPLLSIINGMSISHKEVDILLSVSKRDEIPEYDKLIESVESKGLKMNLLVYEEDSTLFSEQYFKKVIPNVADYKVFICSSPAVRNITLSILEKFSVPKKNIHFEAFSFG